MAGRKSFLVKKGKMTTGEKNCLAGFYVAFVKRVPGEPRRLDDVLKKYPFRDSDLGKLRSRGLMGGGRDMLDITPQGVAVARMLLGLVKRRKRR
jgi:hypothetical protein